MCGWGTEITVVSCDRGDVNVGVRWVDTLETRLFEVCG